MISCLTLWMSVTRSRAPSVLADRLVDLLELEADLVEDREAVVVEVVEHLVEEAARAAREELVAELLVLLARRKRRLTGRSSTAGSVTR